MKLNCRCPLCDGPIFSRKFEDIQENCCLVCPDSGSVHCFSCSISCYFYCSEKKVKIDYITVLEMINYPKILEWNKGCEGYAKIYKKIFEGCCSSALLDKSYEF